MDSKARSDLVRALLELKRRKPRDATDREIDRRNERMAQPDMRLNRAWDRPDVYAAARRRRRDQGVTRHEVEADAHRESYFGATRGRRRRAISRRAEARERGY